MTYHYKVIPFIGQSRGSLSATEVARQLEVAINEQFEQGWEFYQLSDVNIEVQPGCILGLLGAKVEYVRFDQMIFRGARTSADRLPSQASDRRRDAFTPEPGVNSTNDDGVHLKRDDEARSRPSLTIASKHLDYWRRRSDEDLRRAASSLNNYKDEGRQAILAELARRSIAPFAEDQNERVAPSSFCSHCGSDVPVDARTCGTCGKTL